MFRIHAWVGLNAALLVFLLCLSGTVAIFSQELEWLTDPVHRVSPTDDAEAEAFSWQRALGTVQHAYPDALVLRIYASPGKWTAARAIIAPRRGDVRWVFIDPYTYEITGQRSTFGIASFLRIFHKQFYLVPTVVGFHGLIIVGTIGILVLVSMITGLLSYRRWWQALTRFKFGKSPRAFWSDVHRQLGVWALVVSLLLSLTGIWYFVEYLMVASDVISEEPLRPKLAAADLRNATMTAETIDLDVAVARAVDAYPELKPKGLALPVRAGDPLSFVGEADTWVVRDRANQVHLVPFNGDVVDIRRGTELALFERWVETADPLHFGDLGGLGTRILWFVCGLALCAGIVTGVYGVLLRQRQHHQMRAWSCRAALTLLPSIAVVLASVHGIWVYGMSQQKASQRELAYRPVGVMTVGPWSLSVSRMMLDGLDSAELVIRFPRGQSPSVAAMAWIGNAASPPPGTRRPRQLADRLIVRAPSVPEKCPAPCVLNLRLDAAGGVRYTARIVLPERGADRTSPIRHVRPVVPLPWGAVAVILLFAILALAPAVIWGRVILAAFPARR